MSELNSEILDKFINQIEDMIEFAIERTKEMTQVSVRYIHSESITNLAMALLKAQSKFDKAKINAKGYGYSYANLESVIDACRPALISNELALIQLPTNDGEKIVLTTLLIHSSGEFISSEMSERADGGKMTAIQQKGSIITYLRRYSMSAMLGISTGDDNDGADIEEKQHEGSRRQQKQAKQHKQQPKPVSQPKQKQAEPATPVEWLTNIESKTYGDIQAALLMTDKFDSENFALDMINEYPHFPATWYEDGKLKGRIEPSKAVSSDKAVNIFNWCLNNDGKEGNNE